MIRFVIDGQPLPKARPCVTNGQAYTPQKTREWERQIGWAARAAHVEPLAGDLHVGLQFRRKGKRRADIDNMTKAVLDGLNGIAFADDKQIVELCAFVTYGSDTPGITVTIQEVC